MFLDEIQKVVTIQNPYVEGVEDKVGFVDVVLGLMKHDNIDIYVTGSNSKMLSSDILTEFRGRGDEKALYLETLFDKIYLSDIMERNKILNEKSVLDDILNIISSSIGSLTNSNKIANTFQYDIDESTVARYLDLFVDSFIIYKAKRYDIKGRKYIGSPFKFYFSDVGLRNARLNFRQQEENHIMENIIYNELCYREFSVDVSVVTYNYKDEKKQTHPA